MVPDRKVGIETQLKILSFTVETISKPQLLGAATIQSFQIQSFLGLSCSCFSSYE